MDGMRGLDTKQASMLCLMSPEERVPAKHPLRSIKKMVDAALSELSPVFDAAGELIAVLDVDSVSFGAFDDIDARGLERICAAMMAG